MEGDTIGLKNSWPGNLMQYSEAMAKYFPSLKKKNLCHLILPHKLMFNKTMDIAHHQFPVYTGQCLDPDIRNFMLTRL